VVSAFRDYDVPDPIDPRYSRKLVEVQWHDSVSSPGWHSLGDLPTGPARCTSVGYIYLENDRGLGIVSSISPDEYADALFIPRADILLIRPVAMQKQ
jgi:hypothetical protein